MRRQGFSSKKREGLDIVISGSYYGLPQAIFSKHPIQYEPCQPPPPTTGLSCRRRLGVPVIRWGATE